MNRKALGRGLGALLSTDSTVDLGAEPSEVDSFLSSEFYVTRLEVPVG